MVVKQADLRANIKHYFDVVIAGEHIVVPRKENKNIVIISEREYEDLSTFRRLSAYKSMMDDLRPPVSTPDISGTASIPAIKSYTQSSSETIRSDNLNRLSAFGNFKDDWNGNGAPAFDPALLSKVTSIVEALTIQPEIFPSAMGTIDFEYSNSRKDFMSIEVDISDHAEVFISTYFGEESFETIESTAKAIQKRVEKFYG